MAESAVEARIAHIAAVSQNARGTWLALLGVLLFAVIALGGVRDRDFFIADAGARLPFVEIEVPTRAFFVAAPTLILAIHAYLHLYLLKLWRALGAVPPSADDRPLDMVVWPWLLSDAAILTRPDAPGRTLGWMTQAVALAFGWAAAPVALLLFWIRSWPPHDEWLTLLLGAFALVALAVSGVSLALGRALLRRARPEDEPRWLAATPGWAKAAWLAAAAAVALIAWEKTEGGLTLCRPAMVPLYCAEEDVWRPLIRLYPAQLAQAEIVERPRGWLSREEARRAFLADYAGTSRRDLDAALAAATPPDWLEAADAAFDERRAAEIAGLRRLDLSAGRRRMAGLGRTRPVDLREADLRGAFMVGIDLSRARLQGAKLDDARLEAATLRRARLESGPCDNAGGDEPLEPNELHEARGGGCTSLARARMESADLFGADLRGAFLWNASAAGADFLAADIREARLNWADLAGATLEDADLFKADLSYANLAGVEARSVDLADASLTRARMEEAFLAAARLDRAVMWSADLTGAELSNASLRDARLAEAKLSGARLSGADLSGARLRDADLSGVDLSRAVIARADFGAAKLEGARLVEVVAPAARLHAIADGAFDFSDAVGDEQTSLPPRWPPLRVANCLDPPDHLARFPTEIRPAILRDDVARPAERLGLTPDAFVDRHICGPDNPKRWLTGPSLDRGGPSDAPEWRR